MSSIIGAIFLLVVGFLGGNWLQDQVVERCSKGYTFTVKGHKFQCHKSDFKSTIKALAQDEKDNKD